MKPGSTPSERPARVGAPATSPAHELKNLLAVIMGVCETLSEQLDGAGEYAELAQVGLLAAERAGPLVDQLQTAPPVVVAAEPATPRLVEPPARTVLVAEDDPDLLKLMTGAFARAGYRAYSAHNGALAVQLLGAIKPDLLVTDIVMPEKEGIAVIIEARRLAPTMGVIAISGGGAYGRTDNFLQWAEELGADEVMAKPFPMSQLLTAARLVLDGGAGARITRLAAE